MTDASLKVRLEQANILKELTSTEAKMRALTQHRDYLLGVAESMEKQIMDLEAAENNQKVSPIEGPHPTPRSQKAENKKEQKNG